jgi:hypothetical protein
MLKVDKAQIAAMLLTCGLLGCACGRAAAAVRIKGQVQVGGGPLASSTVTLWVASAGEPKQLTQTTTRADGRFDLRTGETPGRDVVLYVVAKGGTPEAAANKGANDAIALMTLLGTSLPKMVTVNIWSVSR